MKVFDITKVEKLKLYPAALQFNVKVVVGEAALRLVSTGGCSCPNPKA